MDKLDPEQVLEHELKLLNEAGENLSHFYTYEPEESIFVAPSALVKNILCREYGINIKTIRTCFTHTNTNLYVVGFLLMKVFFEKPLTIDILESFKCTLYSFSLKMDEIKNRPRNKLHNNTMKKIMVQFFHMMQYYNGPLQFILDKYPIVMEIFTLFLRTALMKMGLHGAENFLHLVDSNQALILLFDYFNIPYTTNDKMYLIGYHFLYVNDQESSYVYGNQIDKPFSKNFKSLSNPEQKLKGQNVGLEESFIFENNQCSRKSANLPTYSNHFYDGSEFVKQKKRISHQESIKLFLKNKNVKENDLVQENSRNSFNYSFKTYDQKKKSSGNRTTLNISNPSIDANDLNMYEFIKNGTKDQIYQENNCDFCKKAKNQKIGNQEKALCQCFKTKFHHQMQFNDLQNNSGQDFLKKTQSYTKHNLYHQCQQQVENKRKIPQFLLQKNKKKKEQNKQTEKKTKHVISHPITPITKKTNNSEVMRNIESSRVEKVCTRVQVQNHKKNISYFIPPGHKYQESYLNVDS